MGKVPFQTHFKCDILLNKLCESFNSNIKAARDKPIITCLEKIRDYMMKRIPKRRIEMERRPGLLCHRIQKLLDKAKDKSWEYICDWNGGDLYEMKGAFG